MIFVEDPAELSRYPGWSCIVLTKGMEAGEAIAAGHFDALAEIGFHGPGAEAWFPAMDTYFTETGGGPQLRTLDEALFAQVVADAVVTGRHERLVVLRAAEGDARRGADRMVAQANGVVEHIAAADALALVEDPDVQFIDLRDVREVHREGHIPGDYHCPRGMLEFWLDPSSEYAKPVFQQDKKYVFYCAAGMRSALAAKTAVEMGLQNVAHIEDGFAGWRTAGGPVKERLRIL